jgi:hypothetical protein
LPKPLPGAEWQLDAKFNVADELLRDPEFKAVLKAALDNGARLVVEKAQVGRVTPIERGLKAKAK